LYNFSSHPCVGQQLDTAVHFLLFLTDQSVGILLFKVICTLKCQSPQEAEKQMNQVIPTYLDLLDSQRETALAAVAGLTPAQLWQRPAPNEWSIGEILNHNHRLITSTMPLVKWSWRWLHKRGERRRHVPYQTTTVDPYDAQFPMWLGFLWKPRYTPRNPVPLAQLATELRDLHQQVRDFYTGKDEDVLGNVFLYDPLLGWLNLITTLRVGVYHDQLHYRDILAMAAQWQETA
jgi:hypothetical protein